MSYDCSITKRKGCNYCQRGKQLPNTTGETRWYVNNFKDELQADDGEISVITIKINYCPICGIKLIGQ